RVSRYSHSTMASRHRDILVLDDPVSADSKLREDREEIARLLARVAQGRLHASSGWEARLVDATLSYLRSGTMKLVREFESIARKSESRGIGYCQDVLTELCRQVLSSASGEPASRPGPEDVFEECGLSQAGGALVAGREN